MNSFCRSVKLVVTAFVAGVITVNSIAVMFIMFAVFALSGCAENTAPKSDQLLCSFDGKAFAYFAPSWEQRGMMVRVPDADDMCLPIKVSRSAEAVG